MKITKRQLRRIIKEEKQKLMRESVADEAALDDASHKLVMQFKNTMLRYFKEDPAAFEGRSTEEDWAWQVEAATAMLEEELDLAIEKVEDMLHDGQFHTG